MIKHKFRTGDQVRVLPDPSNANGPTGLYTIVKVLPVAGRGCQYRAKGISDTYERVLDESLLKPAN